MFRRLGVMAGSASLEFIQQVLVDADDDAELDAWAVLDALDTLVDRSLVAVLPSGDADEPRYRLLETPACLRAGVPAARRASVPALQRRHALAVAAMFDAAYEEYFTGRVGVDDWLRRREADLDHARDALRWARGAGERRGGAAHRHDDAARAAAVAARRAHGAGRCLRGAPSDRTCPKPCNCRRGSS